MNVPTTVPFSAVPIAAVISQDLTAFYMKVDAASVINLADAAVSGGQDPNAPYYVFPGASLTLG